MTKKPTDAASLAVELRVAISAFRAAAEGPSDLAEHDAAAALADSAEALAESVAEAADGQ